MDIALSLYFQDSAPLAYLLIFMQLPGCFITKILYYNVRLYFFIFLLLRIYLAMPHFFFCCCSIFLTLHFNYNISPFPVFPQMLPYTPHYCPSNSWTLSSINIICIYLFVSTGIFLYNLLHSF